MVAPVVLRGQARGLRRQDVIMKFIGRYIADHGYAPTIEEICKGVKISTKSLAVYHLLALERRGFIRRDSKIARSIRIVGPA